MAGRKRIVISGSGTLNRGFANDKTVADPRDMLFDIEEGGELSEENYKQIVEEMCGGRRSV